MESIAAIMSLPSEGWASVVLLACSLIFIFHLAFDLAYDFWRYWAAIRDRFFASKGSDESQLSSQPRNQPIAVMIGAYNEAEVIGDTLRRFASTVQYKEFAVFVGTYKNDPATSAVVRQLAQEFNQIVHVEHDIDGPTTKGDCLNAILRYIKGFEEQTKVEFQIFVVHDAEDFIHPASLGIFDRLLPEAPAVQLPIFPAPDRWYRFIHWVYADEFAEGELKDLPVREELTGFVPLLGVGCAFSRQTVLTMTEKSGGELFSAHTLTEDYSLSLALHLAGIKVHFYGPQRSLSPMRPLIKDPNFVSNYSFFPNSVKASVRQRSRWITGISLQEPKLTGWTGKPQLKFALYKDRRMVLAPPLFLCSLVATLVLVTTDPKGVGMAKLSASGQIPQLLNAALIFVLVLTLIRLVQRSIFASFVYGWKQGLLAAARMPIAIIINLIAATRAELIFTRAKRSHIEMSWDKTHHSSQPLPAGAVSSLQPEAAVETTVKLGVK